MTRGPEAGDFMVVYGRVAQQQPRLELVRLGGNGSDILIRTTLSSAAQAGQRFEQEARLRAGATGALAWRQGTDGVLHRLDP